MSQRQKPIWYLSTKVLFISNVKKKTRSIIKKSRKNAREDSRLISNSARKPRTTPKTQFDSKTKKRSKRFLKLSQARIELNFIQRFVVVFGEVRINFLMDHEGQMGPQVARQGLIDITWLRPHQNAATKTVQTHNNHRRISKIHMSHLRT